MIDILSHNGEAAFYFTVDVATNFVFLNRHANAEAILSNFGATRDKFKHADNIKILSIGCSLPLGFEFWENDAAGEPFTPFCYLFIKKGTAAFGVKTSIDPGAVHIPFANYEMSFGMFYDEGVTMGESYNLLAEFNDDDFPQRISMLNVPAALDEMVFHCPIFAKVEHTLIMDSV